MFLSPVYCSETNLKVKQALTVTAELGEDLQKLTEFNGESTWKIHLTKTFARAPAFTECPWVFLPGCALLPATVSLDTGAEEQNGHVEDCTADISSVYRKRGPPLHAGLPVLCMATTWKSIAGNSPSGWILFFNVSCVDTAHVKRQYKSLCNCTVETVFPKLLASFWSQIIFTMHFHTDAVILVCWLLLQQHFSDTVQTWGLTLCTQDRWQLPILKPCPASIPLLSRCNNKNCILRYLKTSSADIVSGQRVLS